LFTLLLLASRQQLMFLPFVSLLRFCLKILSQAVSLFRVALHSRDVIFAEQCFAQGVIPGRVSSSGLVHMQDTAVLNYSLSIGYLLCIPAM
jgi:hypothetical protein